MVGLRREKSPSRRHAQVLQNDASTLRLGFSKAFYCERLSKGESNERLKELVAQGFGAVKLVLEMAAESSNTLAAENTATIQERQETQRQEVVDHPLTQAVLSAMDGQVVDVRVEDSNE